MSGVTDTLTCLQCKNIVPRKKFCCECGEPLAIVTQPKTTNGEPHPPVQVSDSVPTAVESKTEQEALSSPSSEIPPSVVTSVSSSAHSQLSTKTSITVVSSDGSQQGSTSHSTSKVTPTMYSVVLSQSQPGHETGLKHTQQPGPSEGSPTGDADKSATSHSLSSPTTEDSSSIGSSAKCDKDKVNMLLDNNYFECTRHGIDWG